MDRRETLKGLLIGGVAGAAIGTASCKNPEPVIKSPVDDLNYGRTPHEKQHDKRIFEDIFLDHHELETIALICDIILPATANSGSAVDAGVPDFIEFMVKDLPKHQIPIRGGIMWIDAESNKRFNKLFSLLNPDQQISIIEDIAYPDHNNKRPTMSQGIKFFSTIRNLTLTGYYTSKMGFEDLGYVGNRPNLWDGVPEEVLQAHDVDYDPEWIAKCVNQEQREIVAEWDEEGNLLT